LPEDVSSHANDAIMWNAIHQACEEGYRFFDFGEVPEARPGLARFKTKWGAEPRPLYRYYYPHVDARAVPPQWLLNALTQTWQHIPLPITARVGEWLYGYL
jgi:hypothetical protein